MQADLVASGVDTPEDAREATIGNVVPEVEVTGAAAGLKVEDAREAVAFADVHQQVERVKRVSIVATELSIPDGAEASPREARIVPKDEIA